MHEIYVRFTGRSGNHFVILLNIVRQVKQCTCVLRFNKEDLFRVGELHFEGSDPIPSRIYNFPWQGSIAGIHDARHSSWKMQRLGPDQECRDVAQRYILPIIKFPISPSIPEQVCVIHLRTIPNYINGDRSSHGYGPHYYRQPTASYYDRSIHQFLLLQMKVLLVVSPPCGDSRKINPAVKYLVDKYRFATQTSSMNSDVEAISRAHTIVWSVSSFIWMCSLLSKNVKHNIVPSDFGWRTALCSSPGVGDCVVKTSIVPFDPSIKSAPTDKPNQLQIGPVRSANTCSGRNAEAIRYDTLGDSPFLDRPKLKLTSLGDYPQNTVFLRGYNDDKNTAAGRMQWCVVVDQPVVVYLDFWGGEDHASMGFKHWSSDWSRSNVRGVSFAGHEDQMGPGCVYEREFGPGEFVLFGNAGKGHGAYLVFVVSATELKI